MTARDKIEKVRDMFQVSSEPYRLLSEALAELDAAPQNAPEPAFPPKRKR